MSTITQTRTPLIQINTGGLADNRLLPDCRTCRHRCDGKSYGNYQFIYDLKDSERVVQDVAAIIQKQSRNRIICERPNDYSEPDLLLRRNIAPFEVIARVEVKYDRRAFMQIEKYCPYGNLKPWNTCVINESDLIRYIDLASLESIPTYVVWKIELPCLGTKYYFQDIDTLATIREQYQGLRRYRRRYGRGDIDKNGMHCGVTVNYHFSIQNDLVAFSRFIDILLSHTN